MSQKSPSNACPLRYHGQREQGKAPGAPLSSCSWLPLWWTVRACIPCTCRGCRRGVIMACARRVLGSRRQRGWSWRPAASTTGTAPTGNVGVAPLAANAALPPQQDRHDEALRPRVIQQHQAGQRGARHHERELPRGETPGRIMPLRGAVAPGPRACPNVSPSADKANLHAIFTSCEVAGK